MAEARALRNPPIQEAVIDFRVIPGHDREILELKAFADGLVRDFGFAQVDEMHQFETSIGIGVAPVAAKDEIVAYILRAKDDHHVVQVRRDKLAVSFVRHYEGWEELEGMAKKYFDLYAEFWRPKSIDRVGVRFVNAIALPTEGSVEVEDYLPCAPSLPKEGPQQLLSFTDVQIVRDEPNDIGCAIRQSTGVVGPDRVASFVVDIDVSKEGSFDPTFESVKALLGTLRALKNVLFFGLVTERALEPYA